MAWVQRLRPRPQPRPGGFSVNTLRREVVQVGGGAQDFYYWTFTEKISGDELFTFVGHLKHYGSYTLRLRACHNVKNETRADENGKQMPTGRFFKRCSIRLFGCSRSSSLLLGFPCG